MNAYAARRVEQLATADLSGYVLKASRRAAAWSASSCTTVQRDEGGSRPARASGCSRAPSSSACPTCPSRRRAASTTRGCARTSSSASSRTRACGGLFCETPAGASAGSSPSTRRTRCSSSRTRPTATARSGAWSRARRRCRAPSCATRYERGLHGRAAQAATPGRHANVLQHMLGHLSDRLDEGEQRELLAAHRGSPGGAGAAGRARDAAAPPRPAALGVAYLLGQTYLEPHPKELMLRNRV